MAGIRSDRPVHPLKTICLECTPKSRKQIAIWLRRPKEDRVTVTRWKQLLRRWPRRSVAPFLEVLAAVAGGQKVMIVARKHRVAHVLPHARLCNGAARHRGGRLGGAVGCCFTWEPRHRRLPEPISRLPLTDCERSHCLWTDWKIAMPT